MPLTDKFDRKWAHSDTVKVGDVLTCDGGFTCLPDGARVTVQRFDGPMTRYSAYYEKDPFSRLYIECADGRHMLDDQLGEDGELIGLYPEETPHA